MDGVGGGDMGFAARLLGGPYVPVSGWSGVRWGGFEAGDPCHRGFPRLVLLCRSNGGRVPQLPATNPPLPSLSAELSLGRRGADGGVCADGTVSAPLPELHTRHTHEYTDPDTSCRSCPPPSLNSSISSQPSQASHHLISQRQPLHCLLFVLFWALHNLHSKLRTAPAPFCSIYHLFMEAWL